uniref:Uncharacterized protein n=1 Tax=Oryza meridionalis TaxID=40149 RepID=A0A0E0DGI0_9ORYZ
MGLSSVGLVVQPVVAQHSTHRQLPASAIVLPSFLRDSAARFSPVSALGPSPPGSRCATRRAARISVVRERGETTEKALQWRRVFMLHLSAAGKKKKMLQWRPCSVSPGIPGIFIASDTASMSSTCA